MHEKAMIDEGHGRIDVHGRVVALELPPHGLARVEQRLLREDVPVVGLVQGMGEVVRPREIDGAGVGGADGEDAPGPDQAIEGAEELPGLGHVLDHILRQDAVVGAFEHGPVAVIVVVLVEPTPVAELPLPQVAEEHPPATPVVEQRVIALEACTLEPLELAAVHGPHAPVEGQGVKRVAPVVVVEVHLVARMDAEALGAAPHGEPLIAEAPQVAADRRLLDGIG
jgi:hypothetical protein